jgi:8-oxo-dGTP pyrophosphatase MutT (NUDIX family)
VKTCDNASVAALIFDDEGRLLVFDRNTDPAGVAGPAGHIDSHGSAWSAVYAEVSEEVGLTVVSADLVAGGWRPNRCRRQPGPRGVGHQWQVFDVYVTGDLKPSARETRNVRWLRREEVEALTTRTIQYARGFISGMEFRAAPGIEPVWVQWLAEAGLVDFSADDAELLDKVSADPLNERTTT